ncbi:MAG: YkgJ family cysteine cluster protein [Desulfobacterales bacterium]|nr:YkgJ family cysteine cluster protein [Desulfobacterales bacterium]
MLTQGLHLPDHVEQLGRDQTFCFACHPGVVCFTGCCRELELALTPYDALRLSRELGLTNSEFLDRHVVIEQEAGETFPRFYLGMVDDGRASCPFVSTAGCAVYNGRPGACRAYPVGRAAMLGRNARREEFHVLVREPHCRGFNDQARTWTVDQWIADQGLLEYNRINDELLFLFHHPRVRRGLVLSKDERDRFILALYRLDEFRALVAGPGLGKDFTLDPATREAALDNDTELLRLGVRWLQTLLLGGDRLAQGIKKGLDPNNKKKGFAESV